MGTVAFGMNEVNEIPEPATVALLIDKHAISLRQKCVPLAHEGNAILPRVASAR